MCRDESLYRNLSFTRSQPDLLLSSTLGQRSLCFLKNLPLGIGMGWGGRLYSLSWCAPLRMSGLDEPFGRILPLSRMRQVHGILLHKTRKHRQRKPVGEIWDLKKGLFGSIQSKLRAREMLERLLRSSALTIWGSVSDVWPLTIHCFRLLVEDGGSELLTSSMLDPLNWALGI